ncbi:MAG TPA: hypothetical protein EYP55_04955, partial [Anaerolineae bacterium]|nr:hypothetical protein [Anaerolineae bacterium]
MPSHLELPPVILGGDPFNMFRFLYRRDLLWRLFDEEYCLSVMRAACEAGCRAYDLSFEENTRLFRRLLEEVDEPLLGFGNPTWEQGVMLNGRYLQYSRDRILRTLVDRLFPRRLARLVEETLSHEAVLIFGYDRDAPPLTDAEIASIALDEGAFRRRLRIFDDCQYILLGGSDADWLISLGRLDVVADLARIVRAEGFVPIMLCHYASHVVPLAEAGGLDVDGYAVPLNREWSWFSRDETVEVVKGIGKPVIAFMPLASGGLRQDVRGAIHWLFAEVGVDAILFGTATAAHARETVRLAQEVHAAARFGQLVSSHCEARSAACPERSRGEAISCV